MDRGVNVTRALSELPTVSGSKVAAARAGRVSLGAGRRPAPCFPGRPTGVRPAGDPLV